MGRVVWFGTGVALSGGWVVAIGVGVAALAFFAGMGVADEMNEEA